MTTALTSPPASTGERGQGVTPLARPARRAPAKPGRSRTLLIITLASPLLLLAAWQIGAATGILSTRVTSSPVGVLEAFIRLYESGRLVPDTLVSLYRAGLGFAIGFVGGTLIGVLTGNSRIVSAFFDTPIRMINALPFPVLLPIFIMLFGLSELPKIAFIAFIASHPAYINAFAGVRGVDRKYLEVSEVLRLSRGKTLRTITLPSALPPILIGLRYSLMYSVFGLIIAEQLGSSNGLGYLLSEALLYVKFDQLMAIAVIYAIFGVAANLIATLLERVLAPWAYTRKD